jgi:hypothetical protein
MIDRVPFYQSFRWHILIDKASSNPSSQSDCRFASVVYGKDPTLRHFKVASGEVTQCAEDVGKGVLEARRTYFLHPLGRCPDQERQRRIGKPAKRRTPKGISDAESAFEVGRANRLL